MWNNSPPRTRHRLALYGATATYARALTGALRHGRPAPASAVALSCRALAAAASQLAESTPSQRTDAAAAPLVEADTALFTSTASTSGDRATDPTIRPLIHLHRLLQEIAGPGDANRSESAPPVPTSAPAPQQVQAPFSPVAR